MKKTALIKEKRKQNEKRFWEKQAPLYDTRVGGYSVEYIKIITQVKRYMNKDSLILDAACGTGIISLEIAPCAGKVYATDISSNMVDAAKQKAKQAGIQNIYFDVADAYELPFTNKSLDIVLLANVLHVVKEPPVLLAEARRILKDDGVLLTATACSAEKGSGRNIILPVQRLVKFIGIIKYLHFYKKVEIDSLIHQAGFEIIDTENLSEMPGNYFVAAKKQLEIR